MGRRAQQREGVRSVVVQVDSNAAGRYCNGRGQQKSTAWGREGSETGGCIHAPAAAQEQAAREILLPGPVRTQ